MAQEHQIAGKRPTVYDVAALAGVSIATVSFAFTQPHRVRETTLAAVRDAAATLGYVPSGSARGLAKGRTGAIGFYSFDYFLDDQGGGPGDAPASTPDSAWTFPLYVDEVQRGVELECKRRGLALLLSGDRGAVDTKTVADVAGRVDALITFADTVPLKVLRQLSARIPVLEFSQEERLPTVNSLTVDNAGGLSAITEHLFSAHGARRFAFVGSLSTGEMRARYAGFAARLHAVGVPDHVRIEGDSGRPDTVHSALAPLLNGGEMPDAFVCATDQIALVLLQELDAHHVRVPEDVLVTGFDGILAGRLSTPQLSSVEQPMELLGRRAVAIVHDALEGEAIEPVHQSLPTRLLLRGSCGVH